MPTATCAMKTAILCDVSLQSVDTLKHYYGHSFGEQWRTSLMLLFYFILFI